MGSLVIRITVLVADHPHVTHMVSPLAAKAWGSRFGFSLRFEHCLLRVGMGSCQSRSCRQHQCGNDETNASQRHDVVPQTTTMPLMAKSALKRAATT